MTRSPTDLPIVHGGARRLPLRWANLPADSLPPQVISRYVVEPGESCTLHVHTGKAELWVILSGHGIASIGSERHAVTEGDILITPATIPHALFNDGEAALQFVNIVLPTGDAPITTTEIGTTK